MLSQATARVLIVSDTHGTLDARIAALASACDCAVHAGDIGSRRVAERLAKCVELVVVRGNNDVREKWDQSEWPYLQSLPEQAQLELPGGSLIIVHGHRCGPVRTRHGWLRSHFPNARAIVYGHSHRLTCDLEAQPWVLNPGAAGRVRTYGGPSCLMLYVSASAWRVAPLRFEPAAPGGPSRRQRRTGVDRAPTGACGDRP